MDDGILSEMEASAEKLPEREQPYVRRFVQRLRDGHPKAERAFRQHKAGELRAREAIMIGGVPD